MGIFDSLMEKVKRAVEKFTKKNNDSSNDKEKVFVNVELIDPFKDEIIKKYYEIIFAMNKSINKEFLKPEKFNLITKEYIEKQLNESSDEEKIEEALSLFKLSENSTIKSGEVSFLKEFNKGLENKTNYIDENFDVISLCYEDEIKIIEKEFSEILEVVKENPTVEILKQGIGKKIVEKYKDSIDLSIIYKMTRKIIQETFCDENLILQQILVDWLYRCIYNNRYRVQMLTSLKIVSLRALHFEKYGNNREQYTTITEEECRDFALLDKEVSKNLKERPFDKDEILESFVKDLMCGIKGKKGTYSFCAEYKIYTIELIDENDYFFDYLCNLAWKQSIKNNRWTNEEGKDITNSKEAIDVSDIVVSYFSKKYYKKEKDGYWDC